MLKDATVWIDIERFKTAKSAMFKDIIEIEDKTVKNSSADIANADSDDFYPEIASPTAVPLLAMFDHLRNLLSRLLFPKPVFY